jgi:hypothetical protein
MKLLTFNMLQQCLQLTFPQAQRIVTVSGLLQSLQLFYKVAPSSMDFVSQV